MKNSPFPFTEQSVLVHCITNEITNELLANALLFVGAKPIMAEDPREFADLFEQTDSILLNLGRISPAKEQALKIASHMATQPIVLDIVGVAASSLRLALSKELAVNATVVKGNISEMRSFCGLATKSRGVDGSPFDQQAAEMDELITALKKLPSTTTYLATGPTDVIVQGETVLLLENGVAELDSFTGTGDIVGALIASVLGAGYPSLEATRLAVSYFNLCGEAAKKSLVQPMGLADFRQETCNQLSLLHQTCWQKQMKGKNYE